MNLTQINGFLLGLAYVSTGMAILVVVSRSKTATNIWRDFLAFIFTPSPQLILEHEVEWLTCECDYWRVRAERLHKIGEIQKANITDLESTIRNPDFQRSHFICPECVAKKKVPEIVAHMVYCNWIEYTAIITEPNNTYTREFAEKHNLTFRPLTYAD